MNSDDTDLSKHFLFILEEDREHYVSSFYPTYKNVNVCVFEAFAHDVSDYEVAEMAQSLEYTDVIEGEKTKWENISSRRLKHVFQVTREVAFDPNIVDADHLPEDESGEGILDNQEREPGMIPVTIKDKHAHSHYLFLYYESVDYGVSAFSSYENRHIPLFQNLRADIEDDAIVALARSHAWRNHHGHVMTASSHYSSRILAKIVQLGRKLNLLR
jgi:hypothetical protein